MSFVYYQLINKNNEFDTNLTPYLTPKFKVYKQCSI